jgi:hypothetical protein
MPLTIANVSCEILDVTERSDGSWEVVVDLSLRTKNEMFFNKEGKLLGFLPACEDPISLDRVLALCARDTKKEIIDAIDEHKNKRRDK